MSDVFTPKKRSEVMARIRGRGNKETELALAKLFRAGGIRGWRRHIAIMGRPDFVFRVQRVAIFVDGCFWHCCPKHSNRPSNNREFWERKLDGNRRRDRIVNATLRASGWRVIRIWEHDMRVRPHVCVARVARALHALSTRETQ